MPNPTCANCGEQTPAVVRGFTGFVTDDYPDTIIDKQYTGKFLCRRCSIALTDEEALALISEKEEPGRELAPDG